MLGGEEKVNMMGEHLGEGNLEAAAVKEEPKLRFYQRNGIPPFYAYSGGALKLKRSQKKRRVQPRAASSLMLHLRSRVEMIRQRQN